MLNIVEVGGFVCSWLVMDECCDLQFYFVFVLFDDYGCYCLLGDGYMLYVCYLYLCSCGWLYLQLIDLGQLIVIYVNYFGDGEGYDLVCMIEVVKLLCEIFVQCVFDLYCGKLVFLEGELCSDVDFEGFI